MKNRFSGSRKILFLVLTLALLAGLWTSASAAKEIRSVDLTYSVKKVGLNVARTEGEVQERIRRGGIGSSTDGCTLDMGNVFLEYKAENGDWWGIGDGSGRVQPKRDYAICYALRLEGGYDWYSKVKVEAGLHPMSDCPDFYVFVNNTKRTNVFYEYNSYAKMLRIFVPIGKASKDPIVSAMSIRGGDFSMGVGTSVTLKVSMEGSITSKAVKWSVSGGKSKKTKITKGGRLTIGADETAARVTVRAVSVQDPSASATISVTVSKTPPTITSVRISPTKTVGYTSSSVWFYATVKGTQTDKSVTWSVSGAKSSDTYITENGELVIARGEYAGKLTVTAVSNRDKSKSASAVVTVRKSKVHSAVNIVYDAKAIGLSPASTEGKAAERVRDQIGTSSAGFIKSATFPLGYLKDGYINGIGDGTARVSLHKKYYFSVTLTPKAGHMWPASIIKINQGSELPLSQIKGFSIRVNGKAVDKSRVFIQYYPERSSLVIYVPAKFSIDIKTAKITGLKSMSYTGKALKPKPVVSIYGRTLKAGKDYKVTYTNNKNAGKATVTIRGVGEYTGVRTATFKINPRKINKVESAKEAVTYNGQKQAPGVKVYARLGGKLTALKKNVDYTVTYTGNLNVGTATATVRGQGNFAGTLKTTFRILRCSLRRAAVTVNPPQMTRTGSPLKPEVKVQIRPGGKTLTLVEGKDYTVTYKNNVKIGTATVVVHGMGNFMGFAKTTFKIVK